MKIPTRYIIQVLSLIILLLSLNCHKENISGKKTEDIFSDDSLSYRYRNYTVSVFLQDMLLQKGMPQRILNVIPIEMWNKRVSYTFEYVDKDSVFVVRVESKRKYVDSESGDKDFSWSKTVIDAEIPLYLFKEDTLSTITVGKYKMIKEKYINAVRERHYYFDKSMYEAVKEAVGEDSLQSLIKSGKIIGYRLR